RRLRTRATTRCPVGLRATADREHRPGRAAGPRRKGPDGHRMHGCPGRGRARLPGEGGVMAVRQALAPRSGSVDPALLERVRGVLAAAAEPPTPARVAAVLRAEGAVLGDAAVLEVT